MWEREVRSAPLKRAVMMKNPDSEALSVDSDSRVGLGDCSDQARSLTAPHRHPPPSVTDAVSAPPPAVPQIPLPFLGVLNHGFSPFPT